MLKKKRKYCNVSDVGSVVTHKIMTNEAGSKQERDFCVNAGKRKSYLTKVNDFEFISTLEIIYIFFY